MLSLKRFPKFITVALLAANFGATVVADETRTEAQPQVRANAPELADKAAGLLEFSQSVDQIVRDAERIKRIATDNYSDTRSNFETYRPWDSAEEQKAEDELTREFGLLKTNFNSRAVEMAEKRVEVAKKYQEILRPLTEKLKRFEEVRAAIAAGVGSQDPEVLSRATAAHAAAPQALEEVKAAMETARVEIRSHFRPQASGDTWIPGLRSNDQANHYSAVEWLFKQAKERVGSNALLDSENWENNLEAIVKFPLAYDSVLDNFSNDQRKALEAHKLALERGLEEARDRYAAGDRSVQNELGPVVHRLEQQQQIVAEVIRLSDVGPGRGAAVDAARRVQLQTQANLAQALAENRSPDKIVKSTAIGSVEDIREFMPNFKVSVNNLGEVRIGGEVDRRCLDQMTFELGNYDAKNKVHPLVVTQNVKEGQRNFCTRTFYNQCRADRNCMLVGRIGRVEKDGHIRLANSAYGAGDENDGSAYTEIPGLEEAYLSPRSRILQEQEEKKRAAEAEAKRALEEILAKEEARIAPLCEAAVEGDRSAIDELTAMGLDVTRIMADAVKNLIASLNKKITDADSLAKLRKLIKEIENASKVFPEQKEQFADLLLQIKDAALAMETSEDGRQAMLGHGAETFKVARAALKAAKRIDKANSEVKKALAELALDEVKFAASTGDTFYYSNVRNEAVRGYYDQYNSAYRRQFLGSSASTENLSNMQNIMTTIAQSDREFQAAQKRTVEQEVESYKRFEDLLKPADRAPGTTPAPQPAPAPAQTTFAPPSVWPHTAVPGYNYNYNYTNPYVNYYGGNGARF